MREDHTNKISILLVLALIATGAYMLYASQTGRFQKHDFWVGSVAISKKNLLASTSQGRIYLWKDRACVAILSGHSNFIKSISFSPEGDYFVTGSIDKSVKVWSVEGL